MITKDLLKTGIEINGLDETLTRVADMLNKSDKDYVNALNKYHKELISHLSTKVKLHSIESRYNELKFKHDE